MSTQAPAALQADACPEPEQLAAYIDGRLAAGERTQLERHLVGCADCRDIVAGSVEAIKQLPAVADQGTGRRKWVALAGGLVAAAAAVVLMVRVMAPSPYYVPEMAELVRVEPSTRAVEPRVTGGFRYAPPPAVTRGAGDTRNLELAATADKVRAEIVNRTGAAADAARGVTFLLSGDPEAAIAALERATTLPSASAQMSSDLSAAYLARSQAGDAERALTAAERAVANDSTLREGRFNRALALERLQRTSEAVRAWKDYAARETDAQWVAEAQRHVDHLEGRS
jgi:tetratricopeptide (TPR) repeat protein